MVCSSLQRCNGFTFVGLLMLVAILSVTAAATLQLGAVVQRRDAEQELLAIGRDFQAALFSYQTSTPVGMPRFPRELTDLLRDPRWPGLRRHLRQIPVDPIAGDRSWGLVRTPDGYIAGVHSLSEAMPIKIDGFEPSFAKFAESRHYTDWVFGTPAESGLNQPAR